MEIPRTELGNTERVIPRLGFGGGWIIEDERISEDQAIEIIQKAIDLGINYFDTASSYGKGDSERRIGKAISSSRDKVFLATKVLSRTKEEAKEELENSFSRLNTDFIDLVQIHAINHKKDLEAIFAGGSLEAIKEFRKEGKVGFIGITGHREPRILLEALKKFEFDSVMFPVNPGEEYFGGFKELTEEYRKRNIGSIGMKVIGEGKFIDPLEDYFSYALGYVDIILVGIKTLKEIEEAVEAIRKIKKLSDEDKKNLELKAEKIIRASKKPETFWWRRS